jgi:anti-anti-sigma factor
MEKNTDVRFEQKMNSLWVTIPGSINSENYVGIERQIAAMLKGNKGKVVLDCGEIEYLYSSAIGLLIRTRNAIVGFGGEMVLVNVSEPARESLASMNLDRIFTVFPTDLEFEISQETVWEEQASPAASKFLCVSHTEGSVCYINLTGKMMSAEAPELTFDAIFHSGIATYVFDLTGLEMINSNGAYILIELLTKLNAKKAVMVSYGACEMVQELLVLLGISDLMPNFINESLALEDAKKKAGKG